jgi:hypothetical protein
MLTLNDGRVLVAGGANANEGPSFSSTRLWDPVSERWDEGPLMLNARTYPFGVVLSDDRVLVGGGTFHDGVHTAQSLATVESWDPAGGTWVREASLPVPLGFASAVRLSDRTVLVIGSRDPVAWDPGQEPLAFVFEPNAGRWSAVESPGPSWDAELLALDNGALLLSGTARRFERVSGRWKAVQADRAFDHAQAVLLPSGQVLVAGGQAPEGPPDDSWPALDRVDLWDSVGGTWARADPLPEGHQDGELVVLADGSVIYAGGSSAGNPTATPSCPSQAETSYRYVP